MNKRRQETHDLWVTWFKETAPLATNAITIGIWFLRERKHRKEREEK